MNHSHLEVQRRRFLARAAGGLLATGLSGWVQADTGGRPAAVGPADRQRLLMAWRWPTSAHGGTEDRVGLVEVDWASARVEVVAHLPAPRRAHGLNALEGGEFLAIAGRPGTWLVHADAQGREIRRLNTTETGEARTFNGHAEVSGDGQWLMTTETDPADGSSWLSVRDARTLRREAQWRLPGVDAHQMLLDTDGRLMVAVGGIPRDAQGQPRDLSRMAPALLRVDPENGQVLGRWTLPDARLSVRHMAWGRREADGVRRLGVALQAEHDDAAARAEAPVLAVWDGERFSIPSRDSQAGGYAGDVAAGPAGGFVLSAEKQHRGLWWQPGAAGRLTPMAEMERVCALASWGDEGGGGVVLLSRAGVARWHLQTPPRLLRWPQGMVPDNHAVLMA